MKKWMKILAVVFCLLMVQIPVLEPVASVQTVQAATTSKVKAGLKKENGQYYYYVKGKKVKNTWKTVTVTNSKTGKKTSCRYYFTATGKAYKGGTAWGENYITVKKIGGKYYGFNKYAQMVKGIRYSAYGSSGKGFYVFNTKTGVYDSKKTAALRKAFVREKSSATLRRLLGKPVKTKKVSGCYGNGQEYMLDYTTFWVNTYKDKKGKEIVLDVISK
mgnify:FL=1